MFLLRLFYSDVSILKAVISGNFTITQLIRKSSRRSCMRTVTPSSSEIFIDFLIALERRTSSAMSERAFFVNGDFYDPLGFKF